DVLQYFTTKPTACYHRTLPSQIRHQARVYYAAITQKNRINSPPPFNASIGWLAAFKKHYEVKFAHYHGESASADVLASPPRNREVLPVCEFWEKYNIKNAVDRIVEAWHKINVVTVLHTWKPLFINSEVCGTEQTKESEERKSVAATLMETVETARSVPAPGFSNVQVENLQEIAGQHQQQPTIEEMLEEDEEQEEHQATQEDDIKPGEPTTQ
ncbi:putative Tc5 transposase DNA-binding domain-containing protein 6, partial [Homarus americanus]